MTELRFPVQTSRTENGWLLDFGEELTGTFSMKAVGKAGNVLTQHNGEELESTSAVRYEMRTNCNYEDRRIFEDEEIELILCDLELPDGTAMELFHTLRRVAGMFQMKNPPGRLLPFFILTEINDLATEYEYRHEGVNDYITAPVNIPELIRRVLCFVE